METTLSLGIVKAENNDEINDTINKKGNGGLKEKSIVDSFKMQTEIYKH